MSSVPTNLDLAPRHLRLRHQLLLECVPEAEASAFGSRVNGGGHQGSDLGLVLRRPDDPTQRVTGVAALRQALSGSMLPILAGVHDCSTLAPAFHQGIERAYMALRQPPGAPEIMLSGLG